MYLEIFIWKIFYSEFPICVEHTTNQARHMDAQDKTSEVLIDIFDDESI